LAGFVTRDCSEVGARCPAVGISENDGSRAANPSLSVGVTEGGDSALQRWKWDEWWGQVSGALRSVRVIPNVANLLAAPMRLRESCRRRSELHHDGRNEAYVVLLDAWGGRTGFEVVEGGQLQLRTRREIAGQ
jgi:hypothetical protein